MFSKLLNPRSSLFKIIFGFTIFFIFWNHFHTTLNLSYFYLASQKIMFGLSFVLILFAVIPWYGIKYRGLGISDHYEKMLLATVYFLCVDQILFFVGISCVAWNIFLSITFLILIAINTVLLYYHFTDHDKTPPAYFAANIYLKE